jgi:ATP-dependent exoDNAse (exonuclease V) beta subunit
MQNTPPHCHDERVTLKPAPRDAALTVEVTLVRAVDGAVNAYHKKLRGQLEFTDFEQYAERALRRAA